MSVLKPHKIEPPQWVVDEKNRAKEMCDLMTKLQDERRTSRSAISLGLEAPQHQQWGGSDL